MTAEEGFMRRIVAIGGGEIAKVNGIRETLDIDREIIRLTGIGHPNLLFIPTASHDSVGYCDTVNGYFGDELGCKVDSLLLYTETDKSLIQKKIMNSDIIYVGGGNTYAMMRKWKSMGVDSMLKKAMVCGTIMSGLSAGSICWFRYGSSSSRIQKNPNSDMIKVTGLGFVDAVVCPHYNTEQKRAGHLDNLMKKITKTAIALDDCCAIEIVDEKFRIIASAESANAYKIRWNKGKYIKEKIVKSGEYQSLVDLIGK